MDEARVEQDTVFVVGPAEVVARGVRARETIDLSVRRGAQLRTTRGDRVSGAVAGQKRGVGWVGRVAEVDRGMNLDEIVLHLARQIESAAQRAARAREAEAEASVRQARDGVVERVEAQWVDARGHGEREDLFRSSPRPVTIEVHPSFQHAGRGRGHFHCGHLASDDGRREHHAVLVVEPVAVVADRGDRRLTVRLTVDAAAQTDSRVDGMVRAAVADQRPVGRRRVAEVQEHGIEREDLYPVVLHLTRHLDDAARRAAKAFGAEAEASVGRAHVRIVRHVEAQQVYPPSHWQEVEDLVRDEPRLVAIEVDPRLQHTRHRRGHFDRGHLTSDDGRGKHHPVLVVEPIAVVAARGNRRLSVHLTVDAAAEIHGRVDAVGRAALVHGGPVGRRRVAEVHQHRA